MASNPSCTRCPLHLTTSHVCLWGYGPPTAKIMLIGEAPGAEEEKTGRPFVGSAGQVLTQALMAAGLTREDVYITNTAKCRPPNNRTPAKAESDSCLTYLLDEIEERQPAVIVVMGNSALETVTGTKAITKARGHVLTPRKGLQISAPIIGTLHPASVLYSRGKGLDMISDDLRMAKSIAHPPEPAAHRAVVFPPIDTQKQEELAVALLLRFRQANLLSVDLEWKAGTDFMLWPWNPDAELISIALSGRIDGEVCSLAFAWPATAKVRTYLAALLKRKPSVYHNAMADLLWLHHERIQVLLAGDTMLLGHLLDETQSLKLEMLAPKYSTDVQAGWKGHLVYHRPGTRAEWMDLLKYNTDDTRATLLAFEGIVATFKKMPPEERESLLRVHREILLPVLPVLLRAAYVGVPLDEAQLAIEYTNTRQRYIEATERLASLAEITPLQAAQLAGSTDKTKAFLSGTLGIDLTDSRQNTLKAINQYPAVAEILLARGEAKLLNAYLEPWRRILTRQKDGRLHTLYRLTGTRTGRLSSELEEGGPLQVTPREPWVRRLIAAPPGRLILGGDYSQVELRVGAWISQEPTMLETYRSSRDADLHMTTAAFLKACAERPMTIQEFQSVRAQYERAVTKPERQKAKGANFGLLYGMQDEKFMNYARTEYGVVMTLEEASFVRHSYFQLYSRLPAWHDEAMQQTALRGYTETPFGRRRRFEPDDVHAAINTPVQSTASDLTLIAMAQIDRQFIAEGLDAVIIGFVHDSVLVDVHEQHAARAEEIMVEQMENVDTSAFGFTLPIPLKADTKIGKTWDG